VNEILRTEGMDISRAASLNTPILAGDTGRKAREDASRNDGAGLALRRLIRRRRAIAGASGPGSPSTSPPSPPSWRFRPMSAHAEIPFG
jgi:hypothetical protein